VLFTKSAFGQGFGSEAPDILCPLKKALAFFFFLRYIILLNNIIFSFLRYFLCTKKVTKEGV